MGPRCLPCSVGVFVQLQNRPMSIAMDPAMQARLFGTNHSANQQWLEPGALLNVQGSRKYLIDIAITGLAHLQDKTLAQHQRVHEARGLFSDAATTFCPYAQHSDSAVLDILALLRGQAVQQEPHHCLLCRYERCLMGIVATAELALDIHLQASKPGQQCSPGP